MTVTINDTAREAVEIFFRIIDEVADKDSPKLYEHELYIAMVKLKEALDAPDA
jgi:hypothetical protein